MKIKHLRHGSSIIEYKGMRFLTDPVLAKKGSMPKLPMGRVDELNPLIELTEPLSFLENIDALIITHMHFDHFDDIAIATIDKNIPIICNPVDEKKINKSGFYNTFAVNGEIDFKGVQINITGGQHGKGIRKVLMGKVAGFILSDKADKEPVTYIVGDTIWCDEVKNNINTFKPDVMLLFTGEAKLLGKAITMGLGDIKEVLTHSSAKVACTHLDTWNHCFLTKKDVRDFKQSNNYTNLIVPNEGEMISFE